MPSLLVGPGRIFFVKSCLTGTASVQCCFHFSVSMVCCLLIVFNFYIRALLHFLDPYKFNNKDEFVQNYKNLSSFNEIEVLLDSFLFIILLLWTEKREIFLHLLFCICWDQCCVRFMFSLLIFTWNWGLTFSEELLRMLKSRYLQKLNEFLELKCLLFRNSKWLSL